MRSYTVRVALSEGGGQTGPTQRPESGKIRTTWIWARAPRSGGRPGGPSAPGIRGEPSAGTSNRQETAGLLELPKLRVVPSYTHHNGKEASSSKVQHPLSEVKCRRLEQSDYTPHEICVICGSKAVLSSPPPRSRTSNTASPWRLRGWDGRRPASGAPATGTPGERPLPRTGACPERSRRPRGTSRST